MRAREGSLYRPLVWSLAVLLATTGLLLMIQMIGAEIGPFRFAELGSRDPRAHVGLWVAAGATFTLGARGERWRALLDDEGDVHEIASLAKLDPAELGVLVLAEPRAIGPQELAALQGYLEDGGGVVLTGSVAVREPDGSWRGYQAMRALLGGAEVSALDAERAAVLVPARRGALSAPLLPGERIPITFEPGLPAVAGAAAELAWASTQDGALLGASLRRVVGRGRLAWLAVGPDHVSRGADAQPLRSVLQAAVAWAAHRPVVEVLAWPAGARFAATVDARAEPGAPASPEATARALDREIAAAEASAGLARLRVPLDGIGASEAHRVVADAVGALGKRGAWLATRSELSAWTRARSSIEATVRRAGPQRLVVAVTNRAATAARGVALRVYLNEAARSVSVETTQLLQRRPALRFQPGSESLDLALPDLAARASTAFTLDYQPAEAG